MSRLIRCALVWAAATLAVAPIAEAHYKDDKRWMFGGAITRSADSGDPLDPVNLFFYTYAYRLYDNDDSGYFQRADDHMGQHVRPHFVDEEGLPSSVCYNTKFLSFPARTAPRKESEFTWVAWASQIGSFDRCRTRYHARVWYDHNAPGDSNGHDEPERWIVTPTHHERVNLVRGTRKPRGHYIDRSWELVERDMIRKMRHAPRDGADHRDPSNDPAKGGLGHCADYRWRPLPGSVGWYGAVDDTSGRAGSSRRGFYSDGWLTRISMMHCKRP